MEKIKRINQVNIKIDNTKSLHQLKKVSAAILTLFLLTGCSQYKSSWSCKNPEGIGCSSIGYADRVARKNIILNDERRIGQGMNAEQKSIQQKEQKHKKLLIRERYSDFKKQNQEEVDFD